MYPSRAWTFQEGVLSTRVLLFTKHQVFFECNRSTWCEETHWESDNVDLTSWKAVKNTTPDDIWEDNFDRDAYDMRLDDEPGRRKHLDPTNADLVRQYLPRPLTYDDDILNACTGVLTSIEEREKSAFFFALRIRHFGNDLLFNSRQILRPRFPNQGANEARFPSWSWLSWRGQIEIPNNPRYNSADPVRNLGPCDGVICYMLEADDSQRLNLRLLNETGGWRFHKDYVRRRERACCTFPIPPDADILDHCADVQEHPRNVSMKDVSSHPAYHQMRPNFHIIFRTFCYTVWLVSEDDPAADPGSGLSYPVRNLYTCKDITKGYETACSRSDAEAQNVASTLSTVPPWAYERGPKISSLPQHTPYRNLGEDIAAIPDGVYRLLWMNNNQTSMHGHLLCKSTSPSRLKSDEWSGEILQRVCAVRGPMEISCRHQQEEYAAKWELVVLG